MPNLSQVKGGTLANLGNANNPFARETEKSVYKNCAQRASSLRVYDV